MRLLPLVILLVACDQASLGTVQEFERSGDAPLLYINEFVAQGVEGGHAEGADWLEIYNGEDVDFSLEGVALWSEDGGDGANQVPWSFPADTVLLAGERLVVVCDQGQGDLHASFRIRQGGGTIHMYDRQAGQEEGRIDAIAFGEQADGMSAARVPDGSTNWEVVEPTPGEANQ